MCADHEVPYHHTTPPPYLVYKRCWASIIHTGWICFFGGSEIEHCQSCGTRFCPLLWPVSRKRFFLVASFVFVTVSKDATHCWRSISSRYYIKDPSLSFRHTGDLRNLFYFSGRFLHSFLSRKFPYLVHLFLREIQSTKTIFFLLLLILSFLFIFLTFVLCHRRVAITGFYFLQNLVDYSRAIFSISLSHSCWKRETKYLLFDILLRREFGVNALDDSGIQITTIYRQQQHRPPVCKFFRTLRGGRITKTWTRRIAPVSSNNYLNVDVIHLLSKHTKSPSGTFWISWLFHQNVRWYNGARWLYVWRNCCCYDVTLIIFEYRKLSSDKLWLMAKHLLPHVPGNWLYETFSTSHDFLYSVNRIGVLAIIVSFRQIQKLHLKAVIKQLIRCTISHIESCWLILCEWLGLPAL